MYIIIVLSLALAPTTKESQGEANKQDKQEDDKMLEIVGKEGPEGGVVMMTPEEIAQARYQQENPLIAGGVEEGKTFIEACRREDNEEKDKNNFGCSGTCHSCGCHHRL